MHERGREIESERGGRGIERTRDKKEGDGVDGYVWRMRGGKLNSGSPEN